MCSSTPNCDYIKEIGASCISYLITAALEDKSLMDCTFELVKKKKKEKSFPTNLYNIWNCDLTLQACSYEMYELFFLTL